MIIKTFSFPIGTPAKKVHAEIDPYMENGFCPKFSTISANKRLIVMLHKPENDQDQRSAFFSLTAKEAVRND